MGTLTSGELGFLVFLAFLTIGFWVLFDLLEWLFWMVRRFIYWLLALSDDVVTCPGCDGAGCVEKLTGDGWQRCLTCAGLGELVSA